MSGWGLGVSKPADIGAALASDPGVQKSLMVAAGASGAATGWATMKEIVLELFGVPLPMLLACATVTFGALSFRSGMTYVRTLGAGIVWTVVGSAGAQLAIWLMGKWLGGDAPTAALTGIGMLVSGLGALLVTPENVEKARTAFGRRIDRIGGSQL